MDINVRPKMGCVRAKIGLTGQLDRRQLENYFKPWIPSRGVWGHAPPGNFYILSPQKRNFLDSEHVSNNVSSKSNRNFSILFA